MTHISTEEETKRKWRRVGGLVPIVGKWEIGAEEAKFTEYDQESFKIGIAVSSVQTADGDFRAKVRLSETEEGCAHFVLGYDSETGTGFTVGLGGYDRAYSITSVSLLGNRPFG